jgi:hypothetical protein
MAANDRREVLVEYAAEDNKRVVELWTERYFPKRTPEQIKEQGWLYCRVPDVTYVGDGKAQMRVSSDFFHHAKTQIPLTIIAARRSIEE